MKPVLLISDLHLEDARPDITRTLLHFLEQHGGNCEALYILGDLFEVWIGDDEVTPLSTEIAEALSDFNAAGSEICIMHGNRDFLIGNHFAAQCESRLVQEPYLLQSGDKQFLLLHGDILCTDDQGYMEFRKTVRNPDWQQEFLGQSLDARRAFARQAREQSQAATASKAMEIMDVNQDAVLELIEEQQQTFLIHGHTHRPGLHQLELNAPLNGQEQANRMVLGDWDKKAWFIEISEGEASLQHFPLLAGRI